MDLTRGGWAPAAGGARSGDRHEADSLAERLSEMARTLQDEDDVAQTLDYIVRAAVDNVPGAQEASVSSVRHRREVQTRAATSDFSRAVDQAQYDAGEGPCLETLYERETVRLDDLARERRWPEFTKRVGELGVGSMLTVQLFVEGDDLGALNLLSSSSGAFTEDSEHAALLFASHAAVALAGAEKVEHLQRGMTTRDLIGQAKGILMERLTLTGDQAFRLLVQVSQARNRKLHEVAGEVVAGAEGVVAQRSAGTRSS